MATSNTAAPQATNKAQASGAGKPPRKPRSTAAAAAGKGKGKGKPAPLQAPKAYAAATTTTAQVAAATKAGLPRVTHQCLQAQAQLAVLPKGTALAVQGKPLAIVRAMCAKGHTSAAKGVSAKSCNALVGAPAGSKGRKLPWLAQVGYISYVPNTSPALFYANVARCKAAGLLA